MSGDCDSKRSFLVLVVGTLILAAGCPVVIAAAPGTASETAESKARAEAPYDEDALVAKFLDQATALMVRRSCAWALGKSGTAKAVAALAKAIPDAPPSLRTTIAEALAQSLNPDAQKLALSLAYGRDDAAARGAIRGLAAAQNPGAFQRLAEILGDEKRSAGVRSEAAIGLGEFSTPEAYALLSQEFKQNHAADPTLAEATLEGLAKLPFAMTRTFFEALLASPDPKNDMSVPAVSSLASSSSDAAPFLLAQLAKNPDSGVRAAAARSIGRMKEAGAVGAQLLSLLEREKEPAVRRSIFEALTFQRDLPPEELMRLAIAEQDTLARLAGFLALAAACKRPNAGETPANFDKLVVPELERIALAKDQTFEARFRAVMVLSAVRTAAATLALKAIAECDEPKVARNAESALKLIQGKR